MSVCDKVHLQSCAVLPRDLRVVSLNILISFSFLKCKGSMR